LLAIMAVLSISCFAQYEQKMKSEGVIKGSIVINGEKKDGYIKCGPSVDFDGDTYYAYFELQRGIKFIDKETFESLDKIKGKNYIKYGPKDIESFVFDDIQFESVKYCIDPMAGGTNAIPKKLFLSVLKVYDNIKFYAWFEESDNYSEPGKLNKDKFLNNLATPTVAYKLKDADGARAVYRLSVKKELNCPVIQEKMSNKMYKTARTAQENYELTGVRFATDSNIISIGGDENQCLNALQDYVNGVCE